MILKHFRAEGVQKNHAPHYSGQQLLHHVSVVIFFLWKLRAAYRSIYPKALEQAYITFPDIDRVGLKFYTCQCTSRCLMGCLTCLFSPHHVTTLGFNGKQFSRQRYNRGSCSSGISHFMRGCGESDFYC